ncbi:MAG: TRM11 family SAM-dependent methyltransferase [Culicoidibacterales bacterium]
MDYKIETTSMWSFPDRGNWSKHTPYYRGNWSPHVPKNLMLRYTKRGDLVLDPFLGGGTTLIEAMCLQRKCIGSDLSENAILNLQKTLNLDKNHTDYKLLVSNAQNLNFCLDATVDFICTHPPYANAIVYSDSQEDLSNKSVENFLDSMDLVANELYRVLKKGKYCAIMIGDIRKNGSVIPIGFEILKIMQKNKFLLKEIVIKKQHNCSMTEFWIEKSKKYNFLLLEHEYIFILKK